MPKPTKLPLGWICDAMADDEEVLLALLAAANNLWMSTFDFTEVNQIRREYQHDSRITNSRITELSERMAEILRKYVPEFTTFQNRDTEMGLGAWVWPDALALDRAEHPANGEPTLERGDLVPSPTSTKIRYWLGERVVGNTRHVMFYKRARGAGKGLTSGWTVLWDYTERT